MKLVGYILAFYLVLLSGVPCCSFDQCSDDQLEQSASHEQGDEDCGNCSPFFSCEGCAAATTDYQPLTIGIPAIQTSSVYTSYLQLSLPRVHYEFWQPPKIG